MSKLLIIDDHEDIVETLRMIMNKEGFEVEIGYNGQELLDKVENVSPDLILLDIMMPGLTTKQILKELRERNLDNIKIILLTVVRFSDDERKILHEEGNIVDYITKPFDVGDLVSRVKKQF